MLFRCEIHRGHKVTRKLFAGVSLLPLLQDLHPFLVFAQARLPEIIPEVERFDASRSTHHRAYVPLGACVNNVTLRHAFLANLCANVLGIFCM